MKRKNITSLTFAILFIILLTGCTQKEKTPEEKFKDSINSYADQFMEELSDLQQEQISDNLISDNVENINTEISEVIGTPVSFQDAAMKSCVAEALGISNTAVITEEMCTAVTELDCSEHKLSTLADLIYFPNLTALYVDNGNTAVNLKGINKAKNLVSLTLKNCGLSELDRIAELTALTYLDISTNSSSGNSVNDYSYLAALSNLKHLDMSLTGYNAYNRFSLVDGSFINKLTNLEELNVYETCINNYSLASLGKLKKLTISQGNMDNFLKELCDSGAITSLEELSIYTPEHSDDQITDNGIKNYLSKAVNLKILNFRCNCSKLTSLDGLGNLKKLETFYFDNDMAFDIPLDSYNELSKMTSLTDLTMVGAANVYNRVKLNQVTPDDYAFLGNLKSLKTLSIETYSGMGIKCLTGLTNLEQLQLSASWRSYMDEVDISGIDEFKSLKELIYSANYIRFKSSSPLDDLDYLNVTKN